MKDLPPITDDNIDPTELVLVSLDEALISLNEMMPNSPEHESRINECIRDLEKLIERFKERL